MDGLPEQNIFMMCPALDRRALTELAPPYRARTCRPDDLPFWRAAPFDDEATAETDAFMADFFAKAYGGKEAEFFARTLVVVDEHDRPVATCGLWKAYGVFEAIHWLKVVKAHEGHGLGRALLSVLLRDLPADRYPIYLHTQPESFRAIKLYGDVGFDLLSSERVGARTNDLDASLPYLRAHMPPAAFASLRVRPAPADWLRFMATTTTHEF
jgi:ribosomal protein S18 acetylase RimI-like enzyme